MDWVKVLQLVVDGLFPVLLILLQNNTKLTRQSHGEIANFVHNYSDSSKHHYWCIHETKDLVRENSEKINLIIEKLNEL
ncbi:MAG: hypothetical protein HC815_40900 [Richelia sp. RM1_1_1]|nr:hypothetical protein [Richelia sp. RM1_1_1]